VCMVGKLRQVGLKRMAATAAAEVGQHMALHWYAAATSIRQN